MQFFWFGQSFLKIETKESTTALDPYISNKVKIPSIEADIAVFHDGNPVLDKIKGTPFVISAPGEYEVKGMFVWVLPIGAGKDTQWISKLEAENVSVVDLSHLSFVPTRKEDLEKIEGADVLIVPVGGNGVLDSKQAASLVQLLEPRIVIPVCYNCPDLEDKYQSIEAFAKQMGLKTVDKVEKLNVKWQDFSEEEDSLSVVILKEHFE